MKKKKFEQITTTTTTFMFVLLLVVTPMLTGAAYIPPPTARGRLGAHTTRTSSTANNNNNNVVVERMVETTTTGTTTTKTTTRRSNKRRRELFYGGEDPYSDRSIPSMSMPKETCKDVVCDAITEFCGTDGQCHNVNCETLYKYGNPEFTYVNESTTDDLTCYEFETKNEPDREFLTSVSPSGPCGTYDDDNGNSRVIGVRYGCGHYYCKYNNPDLIDNIVVPYNRKCVAKQQIDRSFVCYDMSPTSTDVTTYFDEYIQAVQDVTNKISSNETIIMEEEEKSLCYDNTTYKHQYGGGVSWNDEKGETGHQFPVTTFTSEEFNPAMAMSVVSVFIGSTSSSSVFPDCREVGCLQKEFCGTDNKCHEIHCESFYQYGPPEFTGNYEEEREDPSSSLTCVNTLEKGQGLCAEYSNDGSSNGWPTVIQFACQEENTYSPRYADELCGENDPYNSIQGRYETMNRYCFATPNPYQNFTCYDLDPVKTNFTTYFDSYLQSVQNNLYCDGIDLPLITYPNGTEVNMTASDFYAHHDYHHCISRPGHSDCTLGYSGIYIRGKSIWNSTQEPFDPDRYRYSIISSLDGRIPIDDSDNNDNDVKSGALGSLFTFDCATRPFWWIVVGTVTALSYLTC